MPSQKPNNQSLRFLLIVGLVAWIATFIVVHGPGVILSYLALQVVTSGVFAWFMWKAEHQPGSSSSLPGEGEGEESVRATSTQSVSQ